MSSEAGDESTAVVSTLHKEFRSFDKDWDEGEEYWKECFLSIFKLLKKIVDLLHYTKR